MKKALTVLLLVMSFLLFFVACNDNMVTSNEKIILGKGISTEADFEDWTNRGGRAYLTNDLVLYQSYEFADDILNPNCILDLRGHKLTFGNPADVSGEVTKKAKKASAAAAKVTVTSTVKLEIKSTDDSGASVPAQIEVKQDTTVKADEQGTLIINMGGEVKFEGVGASNEGGAPLLVNTCDETGKGGSMTIADSPLTSSPTDTTSPSNIVMTDSGDVKLEGETKAETGTTVINIVNNVNVYVEVDPNRSKEDEPISEEAPMVVLEDSTIQNTDPKSEDSIISNKNSDPKAEIKFEGDSKIQIPAGGNSFYEISSGEVTLEDGSFRMQQGVALHVYGDAKLTLKNYTIVNTADLDGAHYPAIFVEENGQLTLDGCWVLTNGTAIEVNGVDSTGEKPSVFATNTDIYSRTSATDYLNGGAEGGFAEITQTDFENEHFKGIDGGIRPTTVKSNGSQLVYLKDGAKISINNAKLSAQYKNVVDAESSSVEFGGSIDLLISENRKNRSVLNLTSGSDFTESCDDTLAFVGSGADLIIVDGNSSISLDNAELQTDKNGVVATSESTVDFTDVKLLAELTAVKLNNSSASFVGGRLVANGSSSAIDAESSKVSFEGSDGSDIKSVDGVAILSQNSEFTTLSDLNVTAGTIAIKALNSTFTDIDSITTVTTTTGTDGKLVSEVTADENAIYAENSCFTTITDSIFASSKDAIKLANSKIYYIGHTKKLADGQMTVFSAQPANAVVYLANSYIYNIENESVNVTTSGKGIALFEESGIVGSSVSVKATDIALDVPANSGANFIDSDFVTTVATTAVNVSGDKSSLVLAKCSATAENYALYVNTTGTSLVGIEGGSYSSINKKTADSPIFLENGYINLTSGKDGENAIILESKKSDAANAITVRGGRLVTSPKTVINTKGATSMGMEYYIDVAGDGRVFLGDQTEFWGVEGQQHLHTGALHNDGWYNYYYWLSYAKPTVTTNTTTKTKISNKLKLDIDEIGEVGLSAGFGPISASYYDVVSLDYKFKGSINAASESVSTSKVVGWKETPHSVTETHEGQFQFSADLTKHYFKVDVGYDYDDENKLRDKAELQDFAKIVTFKVTDSDFTYGTSDNGAVKVSSYWYTIDSEALAAGTLNDGKSYSNPRGLYTFVGAANGGTFCTGAVSCTFNDNTDNYFYKNGAWTKLDTDKVVKPAVTVEKVSETKQKVQISSDTPSTTIYYTTTTNGTNFTRYTGSNADLELSEGQSITIDAYAVVLANKGNVKDKLTETQIQSAGRYSDKYSGKVSFQTLEAPKVTLSEGALLNLNSEIEFVNLSYTVEYTTGSDYKTVTSDTNYVGTVDLSLIEGLKAVYDDPALKLKITATAKKAGYPEKSTTTDFVRYPLTSSDYAITVNNAVSDQQVTIKATRTLGNNPWLYYKLNDAVTRDDVPVDFTNKSYSTSVEVNTSGTDCTVNAFVVVDGYLPSTPVSKTFAKLATPAVTFSSELSGNVPANYFTVTNTPAGATAKYSTGSDYVKYTGKTAIGENDKVSVIFTKDGCISSDVFDTRPGRLDVYPTIGADGELVVTGTDYSSCSGKSFMVVKLNGTNGETVRTKTDGTTTTTDLNSYQNKWNSEVDVKLVPGDIVNVYVVGNGKFYSKIENYVLQ